LNQPSYKVIQELDSFFADRKKDDLLLLYFSGHGIKDEDGKLYFATPDTRHGKLRSTALRANDINDFMLRSRSRQQVLVLDCCYSGAFAKGMVAKGVTMIGTQEYFEGSGRVVLTASDSMQYSFEGEHIEGVGARSVFTRALVHGLETGEADLDDDGVISVDELYDYTRKRVTSEAPQQSPKRWFLDVEGKIVIANSPGPLRPAVLPLDLQYLIENDYVPARLKAIDKLRALLGGTHKGLALAAHAALTKLANQDDSRTVSSAAEKCLASQVEPPRFGEEVAGFAVKDEKQWERGREQKEEEQALAARVNSKRLAKQRLLRRLLASCIICLLLGFGSEKGIADVIAGANPSLDRFYFYISASGAGLIAGSIYAILLFNRFPIPRFYTCLLGVSWAFGWTTTAYLGYNWLAGILGGAFIPLLVFAMRRRCLGGKSVGAGH
jgi:hypothetical protein